MRLEVNNRVIEAAPAMHAYRLAGVTAKSSRIGRDGSMAIMLEFIDFIVPISVIRQKYPGGWSQCQADYKNLIGGRVWYDDHLLRDGAMDPHDIEHLVEHWTDLGFEPMGMFDEHQPMYTTGVVNQSCNNEKGSNRIQSTNGACNTVGRLHNINQ